MLICYWFHVSAVAPMAATNPTSWCWAPAWGTEQQTQSDPQLRMLAECFYSAGIFHEASAAQMAAPDKTKTNLPQTSSGEHERLAERFRDNKLSRCCGSLHVNKHHRLMQARRRKCFPRNENSDTLYIPLSRRMSAAAKAPLNTAPQRQVLRQRSSALCRVKAYCFVVLR